MLAELIQHPFMSSNALKENSADAMINAMLSFEIALLESQELQGLCPTGTAERIAQCLRKPGAFDSEVIAKGVGSGGNPAIPFVKMAREKLPDELKPYWHQGATSQDLVDSALMLLLKNRFKSIDQLLLRCRTDAIYLAGNHKRTVMVGRTLMQQALPTTFGVRAIQWALGLEQARRRLHAVSHNGLPVQFGGAVGVHSGLDDSGMDLMAIIADRLGLANPVLPWHTNRQPVHAIATAMDGIAGAAEKMAYDVALLSQTEVGELSEPAGEGMGESSSMPHKRNPVRCALVRSACRQIHGYTSVIINSMAQPLERGLGEWHAEWAALVNSAQLLEGALEQTQILFAGLEVHEDRMRTNLEITGGAIMAESVVRFLTPELGSELARKVSKEASETARLNRRPYIEALRARDEILGKVNQDALANAADPITYIGTAEGQLETAIEWLIADE